MGAKLSKILCLIFSVYPLFGWQDPSCERIILQSEVTKNALSMVGKKYVANTLDLSAEEKLVINMEALDCMTFIEYSIAAAGSKDTICFRQTLQRLRYRNGVLDGYCSRLHYLSEWLFQLIQNGSHRYLLGDGKNCFEPELSFMSDHTNLYKTLKSKPHLVACIRQEEKRFTEKILGFPFFDRQSFSKAILQEGDLVAFKSKKTGLDYDHMGLIHFMDGVPYLLHASTEQGKVAMSTQNVFQYLSSHQRYMGVTVVR